MYTFPVLCDGNPPVTGGFPSQRASNGERFPFDDAIMAQWVGFLKLHLSLSKAFQNSWIDYITYFKVKVNI